MGCRPRARSVLHCHGVLGPARGSLARAVQDESQLQENTSNLEAGSAETAGLNQGLKLVSRQFIQKAAFGLPAAGPICPSLPWCLALREGPWPGAVQDESQLQENASNLEAGSAERQVKSRFEANFYRQFRKQHFANLHRLSSDPFSSLIFLLLLCSSLTPPISARPSVPLVRSLTSILPLLAYI